MRVITLVGAAVVALASLTNVANAGRYDDLERWVNVINEGNSELVDVFITDVGDDSFGRDLFSRGFQLAGGDWATVEPRRDRGYCRYDAKFVFADGSEAFLWDFNLCEAIDIYVDEAGVADVTFIS